ncbi:PLP-dependent aminotransferase family protein [Diaminobutyricimonas sp. TR449]|uniref:MocR-like transcription factor YczR n=1 Tax=Diaminobutyricimonas sp. TR449 TaxID=2708076 RepID=UPI001423D356|nr:PLP-dependent aminotransferase family protein [Diaminobutyricimonas sp. TR449]
MQISARALDVLLGGWRDRPTGPAYAALADRIRLLVLDGRIVLGSRLPAERELASHLGISRTTVSTAYATLRDAGYLESVRGSGSVARLPRPADPGPEASAEGYLDFSKATLPPAPAIIEAAEWAAHELPCYLTQSGFDPVGLPVLRQAIADRYSARGLPTDPEQIMVTIGAQHAIALIARTLLGRGDRALIEAPTYPHGYEALRAAGARLVPVSVDADSGWDEIELEQAFVRTSPTLGYLMPDFHNPTGQSMPVELKARVLELAESQGTRLIADETMAELGFDGTPLALPFAAHGEAILVGSVGKSLWGGLRVGWIRADRVTIARLANARSSGDLGTPLLEQLVVCRLLGEMDTILEDRRWQLRRGHDQLTRLLAERLPGWRVPKVGGGLTVWANLGEPVSSQLALAARNEGLVIAAGPRFGLDGAFERFLRIPFSYSDDELERGVTMLERAWAQVQRNPLPVDAQLFAQVV